MMWAPATWSSPNVGDMENEERLQRDLEELFLKYQVMGERERERWGRGEAGRGGMQGSESIPLVGDMEDKERLQWDLEELISEDQVMRGRGKADFGGRARRGARFEAVKKLQHQLGAA